MATTWSSPLVNRGFPYAHTFYREWEYPTGTINTQSNSASGSLTKQVVSPRSGWKSGHQARLQFELVNGYPPQYSYKSGRTNWVYRPHQFTHEQTNAYNRWTLNSWLFHDNLGTYANSTECQSKQAALLNKLVGKLNTQVRSQYYSAFETLYEGRKTIDMVLGAVGTVMRSARAVRRGRFVAAARELGLASPPKGVSRNRTFGNNWLEYRYGWMPLYYTIYGEMQRQFDRMREKPPVFRVSSGVRESVSKTTYGANVFEPIPSASLYKLNKGTYRAKYVTNYTLGVSGVMYYRIKNETISAATEMGLTNPMLLAWEALPLSFVADWFVNVSDVLENYDTWVGKEYLGGSYTRFAQGTDHVYDTIVGVTSPWKTTMSDPGSYSEGHYVERVVWSSPPTVSLQFAPSLNIKRVLDAASLLRQFFR